MAAMKTDWQGKRILCLVLAMLLAAGCLSACAGGAADRGAGPSAEEESKAERVLVAVDDEPDTVDFQCTTIY